ncbi:hypothetical protein [Anaerotignum lactatifermentans]|uniref:hypothetical protein n=1 Tax=Anaerotignum lactatifermentans TaxID=160404 RepID=UPI00174AC866|nr:hypothetical protein [Anaerotignum lactatifermentans]HJE93339.1 hypothetical protein [Anaerotignum lactatifermentans]
MKKMKKISKKVLTGKIFWDILTPLLRKTRNSKKKNKKLQKSVDKQNTTKYNNKGFAAQEKQTKSVWRGVRVV